jgi:hypothetical protein
MEASNKKVSQEYFDQIVAENMNDFEMNESDAIQDALNQLKSQGVDLSMICKFSIENRTKLIDAIKNLNELNEKLTGPNEKNGSYESAMNIMNIMREKFQTDLSYRCLATNMAKPNAYEIFMAYLKKFDKSKERALTSEEINFVDSFFKTFDSYIYQQSDVLTSECLKLLIDFINNDESCFESQPIILQSILKCINSGCLMNEPNRQFLVENGLCENLMKLIKMHRKNEGVLCQICQLIRSLLLDDDLRVEFGKSHEHAKYIAHELNGIDVLLQIGLGIFL